MKGAANCDTRCGLQNSEREEGGREAERERERRELGEGEDV
jgi:hypothetical protein